MTLRRNLEDAQQKLNEEDDLEIDSVREMLSTDEIVSGGGSHHEPGSNAHETSTVPTPFSGSNDIRPTRPIPDSTRHVPPERIIIDITMLDPTPPPSPRS